jgi:hypothetical protein
LTKTHRCKQAVSAIQAQKKAAKMQPIDKEKLQLERYNLLIKERFILLGLPQKVEQCILC